MIHSSNAMEEADVRMALYNGVPPRTAVDCPVKVNESRVSICHGAVYNALHLLASCTEITIITR